MRTLRVYEHVATGNKQGSSSWDDIMPFIEGVASTAARVLVSKDIFNEVWRSAPTVQTALADMSNMSPEGYSAALRGDGYNPQRYYDELGNLLGESASASWTEGEINAAVSQAEAQSKDPSANMWLFAGVGLLIMLAMGGANTGMRRGRKFRGRKFGFMRKPRYRSARRRR